MQRAASRDLLPPSTQYWGPGASPSAGGSAPVSHTGRPGAGTGRPWGEGQVLSCTRWPWSSSSPDRQPASRLVHEGACWSPEPTPFAWRPLLTVAGFALSPSHHCVAHARLSASSRARPALCTSGSEALPGCPSPAGGPGARAPTASPHLLPVRPGAEAGLAHCLWQGLQAAVPCLGGHGHAEVALGVLRLPFSWHGPRSRET